MSSCLSFLLIILFFLPGLQSGVKASTITCKFRINRKVPCRNTKAFQLTSFDLLGRTLDTANGRFGRRYGRGTIRLKSVGRTFVTYKLGGHGPRCKRRDPALIVDMGRGGPTCRCVLNYCNTGWTRGVVFRVRKKFLSCRTKKAYCMRIRLDCLDSNGCPPSYRSNQGIPSEWNGNTCTVKGC